MTVESSGPGSPSSLRLANQRRVVATLIESGGISQAEIARRTGLAPATVSNIVRELSEQNILRLVSAASGRRGNTIAFSPDTGYALGVSIEREQIRMGLSTLDQTVLDTRVASIADATKVDEIFTVARQLFDAMLEENKLLSDKIVAGCMVLSSAVFPDGSVVPASAPMPSLSGMNIAQKAREYFDINFVIENDANAGALAEYMWGAGRGRDKLVYLEISQGIGAGIILNGEVYSGADGLAGEIGHIPVAGYSDPCGCGNRGCLEAVASGPALVRRMNTVGMSITDFSAIVELARMGDGRCIRILREAGELTAEVMAGVVNVLNPKVLIIGGMFAGAGEQYLDSFRYRIRQAAFVGTTDNLLITAASLGRQAPLRGAMAKAVNTVDMDSILRTL